MLLEIKKLTKNYKMGNSSFEAIRNISIAFDHGELVSIIGESGSGKSTLMNVIGGLDLDFDGEILIDSKDIKKLKEKEIDQYRKNRIGFVFQSFNLIQHLTVLDNVTIAMTLSNVSKKERIIRAKKILTEVGLGDQIYKRPNQLSGGQMQRVAIARALINDPDIILADEPTGSLDSKTSEQILAIIKKIASSGKLVIMVTHSEKVAKISSRVVTISDGLIIDDKINQDINLTNENNTVVHKEKQNLSFFSAMKLAFNNMSAKKTRNILVSIGASIGIMSVVLMLSLSNGVLKYVTDTMEGYVNPLVVEVNKKTETENGDPRESFFTSNPFDERELDILSKINDVSKLEKGYTKVAFGDSKVKYNSESLSIQMIYTVSSNITSENIKSGKLPGNNEILVDEGVSERFGNEIVGKTITLETVIENVKIVNNFVVSGTYGSASGSVTTNNYQVFINYSDLEKIALEKNIVLKPTTIYLVATSQSKTDAIKTEIKNMGYRGSVQEQMLSLFNELLNVITYVLTAISSISLLVSSIMILVVLYISVVERTKEIGVLKAIGARRKDIRRIFSAEAFIIGLLSGVIGIISEIGLGYLINIIVNNLYGVSVVVTDIKYIVFGILVSIIVSMIAGVYPANKASKLDPVEALRRE